jgi:hypothetical protein
MNLHVCPIAVSSHTIAKEGLSACLAESSYRATSSQFFCKAQATSDDASTAKEFRYRSLDYAYSASLVLLADASSGVLYSDESVHVRECCLYAWRVPKVVDRKKYRRIQTANA